MNTFFFPVISKENRKLPYFVVTIGIDIEQPPINRLSGLPEYQWFHCTSGKGLLMIGGKEYVIEKDMGFIFAPDVPHKYYPLQQPWVASWVTFDGYGVRSVMESQGVGDYKVFKLSIPYYASKLLFDINECIRQYASPEFIETTARYGFWSSHNIKANNDASVIASSMLYYFLLNLNEFFYSKEKEKETSISKKLNPAIKYVEKNYHKNISLENLAAVLDITPSHFCRLFKQLYNTRPFTYINNYRIHKAKELMYEEPLLSINEIASRCGFNNFSYFCATFKKHERLSPADFRDLYLSYRE